MAYGMAREIVFYSPEDNAISPYLSELRWEIKPAYLVGGSFLWDAGRKGRYTLTLQGALPLASGQMQDFDWMYTNRSDFTHWSLHDITIKTAFVGDVSGDWPVFSRQGWQITLGTGYHVDWWSWDDAVRAVRHAPFTSPQTYEPGDPLIPATSVPQPGQDGIHYRVLYNVLYGSLGVSYDRQPVRAQLRFIIGPVLAWAHDHHFRRGHYYDTAFGAPWLGGDFTLDVALGKTLSLVLGFDGAWMPEIKGITRYFTESGTYRGYSKSAGFQFWRIKGDVGLRIAF